MTSDLEIVARDIRRHVENIMRREMDFVVLDDEFRIQTTETPPIQVSVSGFQILRWNIQTFSEQPLISIPLAHPNLYWEIERACRIHLKEYMK